MRDSWVTGCADGQGSNIAGRYITPWREDPDVLTASLSGTDHPETYAFDPMAFQEFVASTWRVRAYQFSYAVAFKSEGSGFTFGYGSEDEATATALFPAVGQEPQLGPQEEWRIGAGYRHQSFKTITGLPGYTNAELSVQCVVGGRHQYILPGDGLEQRFRPEVLFSVTLNLNDEEQATWGILANRSGGISIGQSQFRLPYWSRLTGDVQLYNSFQRMVFTGVGNTAIIAPFTATARLRIVPVDWWERRDAQGLNPIFSATTGVPLLPTGLPASFAPDGEPICNPGLLDGVRFVA